MATSTPPTDPDALAVLRAPSREDLSSEDIYDALGGIRHMAGHAIIATLDAHKAELSAKIDGQNIKIDARFDAQNARFDAQNARFDAQNAKIDAQNAELATLRWVVGLGLAALGALMTLLRLFA